MFSISEVLAQQTRIEFLHYTLVLEQDDSIFYRIGDTVNGQVKYGRWGFATEVKIEDGWIAEYKHFYRNGQLWSSRLTDAQTGKTTSQEWNERGVLIENGYYTNGMEDSVWTYYRDDGTKEMECRFLPDSLYEIPEFHTIDKRRDLETGEPTWTHSIGTRSAAHGKWVFYDRRENIIKQLWFDHGKLVGLEFGE